MGGAEIYHEALTSPEEELESVYSGKKQNAQRNKKQTKVKQQQKKKTKPNKQKRERNTIYLVTWLLIAFPGGSPLMIVLKAPVMFCQMPDISHKKEAHGGRDCCFLKKTLMNIYFLFRKSPLHCFNVLVTAP